MWLYRETDCHHGVAFAEKTISTESKTDQVKLGNANNCDDEQQLDTANLISVSATMNEMDDLLNDRKENSAM